MAWIRSATNRSVLIRTGRERLRALLADVAGCGRLMPGVEELERIGDDLYHYRLARVSNGAIAFTPDYVARFDTGDPDAIAWEPHGEHNFRSWGRFLIEDGPTPEETRLRIDTRSEAWVDVAPVVLVLIEPFAQKEMDEVTEGFLTAVKEAAETRMLERR